MGVKEKQNNFFRPDVKFEVDARWLLHPFKDGKKISRDRPSVSLLPPFTVRYCPYGLREGGSKMGRVLARTFLCANSVLRRANDFGYEKSTENHILYLFQPYFAFCLQNSKKNEPFHFGSCGEISLISNLGPFHTKEIVLVFLINALANLGLLSKFF